MGQQIARDIASVRRTLAALDNALARLASVVARQGSARDGAARPTGRLKLTPARRKALQLQGRYIGYVRQLKPRARAQVKALRERKGVRAAIARAKRLAAA